ncbi:hypothetical protein A5904_11885 [Acidithiobacillus caldus]|uniref:Uncharacterized protein n=2 Tax=Acidithiobacillus caldus TaxID=33059 RepID=F9ZRV3_ACICS|nr:conserved hypothetical protein [Acidithiobacillus caldus SM-1]AIA56161.1 hypothetical protein Acaty_c2314 [Acidithiobacillus caldus ATCC 51756]AUW33508.1 hypothetical protein A5904_11885 [Acidithiobacillus caldus]MBU2730087.1 hypothetical protein [Acidithiobacillus caldus]MBU2735199.1 hypothetical protein [Acidithiobacillus caldus ATCC 51756]
MERSRRGGGPSALRRWGLGPGGVTFPPTSTCGAHERRRVPWVRQVGLYVALQVLGASPPGGVA